MVDAEGVQPRQCRLTAHLHDLQLAHHGVALDALAQPDQPVGHREHRVGIGLVEVFADQEGRGLPAGHQHAQLLDEQLQAGARTAPALAGKDHRTERIHEDQPGVAGGDLVGDALEYLVEVAAHGVLGQADEAHAVVDGLGFEEVELLLVAQHLQRRLAQHSEIDRGALWRGQREHDLVRQRGLAAARLAGDEVERELRQAAAEHLVQARHAGGQAVDDRFGGHDEVSCAGEPGDE